MPVLDWQEWSARKSRQAFSHATSSSNWFKKIAVQKDILSLAMHQQAIRVLKATMHRHATADILWQRGVMSLISFQDSICTIVYNAKKNG